MFILFQFLHVLTMFAAVSAAMVPDVVLHVMARRGDVAALRGFLPIANRLGKAIPILFVVGLVFGITAAITGDIDLLRPWLIGSYVVFAIAMATGALLSEPWAQRLAVAAFDSPLEAPSDELRAATDDTRGFAASAILMTSIVVIVFLMVAKPGG